MMLIVVVFAEYWRPHPEARVHWKWCRAYAPSVAPGLCPHSRMSLSCQRHNSQRPIRQRWTATRL